MKKVMVFLLLVFLVPTIAFAVSNAKLNGQKAITVTQFPVELVFTADLAQTGNSLTVEYYIDINGDGKLGAQEPIVGYNIITDGIGWIRDPNDPDSDLAGDETGVDGKITTTILFEMEEVMVPTGVTGIFLLTDEDGSTDQVSFTVQAEFQPPFIMGKVTDSSSGSPLPNVVVTAEGDEGTRGGVTDANGDYKISVIPGTWKVSAFEFPPNHQSSDTVNVTITGTNNETVNFALDPFSCFIEGQLTLENGTPVPGILVFAMSDEMMDFFSFGESNAQGQYRIGVEPGEIQVTVSYLFNAGINQGKNWPADSYADPSADTLNISAGQTLTSNFVFKQYTSFVTGKCTVDGNGLPGVEITGIAMDFTTFEFNYYNTLSDQNGDYRMGVKPGVLSTLQADKEGYSMVSPQFGYQQIAVGVNETVTGKDFDFDVMGGATSISGTVTYNSGAPASNVYVVAVNDIEYNPQGYLITYSDASGNYSFDNILDGYWQVGVYQANYSSTPPMRYIDIYSGMQQTGQNFVLSEGSAVSLSDNSLLPKTVVLAQNYPNPFNPITWINFALPRAMDATVNVFNSRGQLIRTLSSGMMSAGFHQLSWDGRNNSGTKVTSGVYFYQLKTENFTQVKKMILAK